MPEHHSSRGGLTLETPLAYVYGWRKVPGVICDRRLPASVGLKGKVYSSVVRPAMMYGLETVAVTKKQVEEMEVAEMKMLRFAIGDEKRQD